MPDDARDDLRAADADRERVATRLRVAFGEGRLTMAELDERLAGAYGARTLGELRTLTRDLPDPDVDLPFPARRPAPPPEARRDSRPARRPDGGHATMALRAQVASWVSVSIICTVIWLLTGTGSFWPGWVIGPWGAVILAQAARGRIMGGDDEDRRAR